MKCMNCGAEMNTRPEDYAYKSSGLSGVTLGQIDVSRCPRCGEHEVRISDIDGLHRILAECVITKRGRLAAEEVRYLRKYLGYSGVELAGQMGVQPETVSRWENGTPMGPTAERLLRLMVANTEDIKKPHDWLVEVAREDSPALSQIDLILSGGRWEVEHACFP